MTSYSMTKTRTRRMNSNLSAKVMDKDFSVLKKRKCSDPKKSLSEIEIRPSSSSAMGNLIYSVPRKRGRKGNFSQSKLENTSSTAADAPTNESFALETSNDSSTNHTFNVSDSSETHSADFADTNRTRYSDVKEVNGRKSENTGIYSTSNVDPSLFTIEPLTPKRVPSELNELISISTSKMCKTEIDIDECIESSTCLISSQSVQNYPQPSVGTKEDDSQPVNSSDSLAGTRPLQGQLGESNNSGPSDSLILPKSIQDVEFIIECHEEESSEQTTEEEESEDFDPFLFMKRLPSLSDIIPSCRPNVLPKQTRKSPLVTLVLDLDETLVHSTVEHCDDADFSFPVHFNNQTHTVFVRRRPHLDAFMERVSKLFEIIVFTASQSVYAEELLNILDPDHRLIKYRVFRDSCVYVEGNYLKDLSVLGRDLSKVAIVDNSPQAFGFQVDNGIPIESWFDDRTDRALESLLPFLESLADVEDVRPIIAKKFNLRDKIAAACDTSTKKSQQFKLTKASENQADSE